VLRHVLGMVGTRIIVLFKIFSQVLSVTEFWK